MRATLAILLATAALVPAFAVLDVAEACQPRSWICPLNGQWYTTCGPASPPPVLQCATDTLKAVALPPLP